MGLRAKQMQRAVVAASRSRRKNSASGRGRGAKISQLDLAYHDIKRGRGVFDLLQRKGLAARVTTDEEIEDAVNTPPQTTRAKLRGEFISAAQEAGRDFTVDWVHLKLNDQAQRTVLCKDPFLASDPRVDRLIEGMSA